MTSMSWESESCTATSTFAISNCQTPRRLHHFGNILMIFVDKSCWYYFVANIFGQYLLIIFKTIYPCSLLSNLTSPIRSLSIIIDWWRDLPSSWTIIIIITLNNNNYYSKWLLLLNNDNYSAFLIIYFTKPSLFPRVATVNSC